MLTDGVPLTVTDGVPVIPTLPDTGTVLLTLTEPETGTGLAFVLVTVTGCGELLGAANTPQDAIQVASAMLIAFSLLFISHLPLVDSDYKRARLSDESRGQTGFRVATLLLLSVRCTPVRRTYAELTLSCLTGNLPVE